VVLQFPISAATPEVDRTAGGELVAGCDALPRAALTESRAGNGSSCLMNQKPLASTVPTFVGTAASKKSNGSITGTT
jgi:hypothetical protein